MAPSELRGEPSFGAVDFATFDKHVSLLDLDIEAQKLAQLQRKPQRVCYCMVHGYFGEEVFLGVCL
ncbi:UNVERIFIED_CONTAM: hypothetical protein ACS92_03615 [Bacillus cereus]